MSQSSNLSCTENRIIPEQQSSIEIDRSIEQPEPMPLPVSVVDESSKGNFGKF